MARCMHHIASKHYPIIRRNLCSQMRKRARAIGWQSNRKITMIQDWPHEVLECWQVWSIPNCCWWCKKPDGQEVEVGIFFSFFSFWAPKWTESSSRFYWTDFIRFDLKSRGETYKFWISMEMNREWGGAQWLWIKQLCIPSLIYL